MTACARCDSALEEHDLRCSICALPVPVVKGPRAVTNYAKILRCTECGAATSFSPAHLSPHCVFCNAEICVEQPFDPIEQAEVRVPFLVDRLQAEAALRSWLSTRGFFAPKALRDDAVLESLRPIHWAAWIVDATAAVAWTADSDHGARRSDWAPHAGEVSMQFDRLCVPASRGLELHECHALAPHYELGRAVAITSVHDDNIEAFEAQRSAARHLVRKAIEANAQERVKPFIPGKRVRKVHVACLVERQTTRRVALPAWILAYRYRDRPYRAIVHGQHRGLVVGASPKDWTKIGALAAIVVAVLAVLAILFGISGCGSAPAAPDAVDFTERCTPSGPFAPLTGRAAVQASLNVHIDAGGLIEADTTGSLVLAMDLVQMGTSIAVSATACRVTVPGVPLAGQEMPVQLIVPEAAIASVGAIASTATLSSPDESCATLDTQPLTIVLGARLANAAGDPLPSAASDGSFRACDDNVATSCAAATATGCACDQESDGEPGATFLARNVPGLELDQVYVTLRTTFSLHGRVFTTDAVKGQIEATLDSGVLHCRLANGTACTADETRLVQTLNPTVTPQVGNPSTFRSVRIPDSMTCAEIVANEGSLFPR